MSEFLKAPPLMKEQVQIHNSRRVFAVINILCFKMLPEFDFFYFFVSTSMYIIFYKLQTGAYSQGGHLPQPPDFEGQFPPPQTDF